MPILPERRLFDCRRHVPNLTSKPNNGIQAKARETMFSDFEYEIAILGNETIALQFATLACSRFARVVLIEEAEFVSDDSVAGLTRLVGKVRFESDHQLICETERGPVRLSARHIVIATGSHPVPPRWMIEHPQVVFSECEDSLRPFDSLAIAGGDSVKLVSGKDGIREELIASNIIGLSEELDQIRIFFSCGRSLLVDAVLAAHVERRGATSSLNLAAAGLFADDRGCLWCNDCYETWASGIFAIGSVVGYPAAECTADKQIEHVMNSIMSSRTESICLADI